MAIVIIFLVLAGALIARFVGIWPFAPSGCPKCSEDETSSPSSGGTETRQADVEDAAFITLLM